MQLGQDSLTSRALSAEGKFEPACSPHPEPQAAASRSNENPLLARFQEEIPSTSCSYLTAWTGSQKKTASSSRCGVLLASERNSNVRASEEPSVAWSASKHLNINNQEAYQISEEDEPEGLVSRAPSPEKDPPDFTRAHASERSPTMHTARTQISASESSLPVTVQKSAGIFLDIIGDIQSRDAPENGCQLEDQTTCPEPVTPLVSKPQCLPAASFPAAAEIFQTPPSDCAPVGSQDRPCSSVAGYSDEDDSPQVPQSTARRGCKRFISSDDEEQPGNESSLPFLAAVTCFDSTFSRPLCPTTGSGYAPVKALPVLRGSPLLRVIV